MSALVDHQRPPCVSDVMSRRVLTVEVSKSLWDAWQLLFVSGLRHLVVVNVDGSTVGVLSDRNVLADVPATAEHLGRRQVADVMAQVPLVHVRPGDSPVHAAEIMTSNMVEAVPVLEDDGRLVGIVTESDIVRWVVSGKP
jgi:CBS domain-containing protein